MHCLFQKAEEDSLQNEVAIDHIPRIGKFLFYLLSLPFMEPNLPHSQPKRFIWN